MTTLYVCICIGHGDFCVEKCPLQATAKPASDWGKSDAALGVPEGVIVEDFADSTLAPGLSLQWSEKDGAFSSPGQEISYTGSKAFSSPTTRGGYSTQVQGGGGEASNKRWEVSGGGSSPFWGVKLGRPTEVVKWTVSQYWRNCASVNKGCCHKRLSSYTKYDYTVKNFCLGKSSDNRRNAYCHDIAIEYADAQSGPWQLAGKFPGQIGDNTFTWKSKGKHVYWRMRCFSGSYVNNWQLTEDGVHLFQPTSTGGLTTVKDLLTVSKDPGSAFKGKAFWGSSDSQAVTNFARDTKINYGDAANWRRLRMRFKGGATFVGFSLQQVDTHDAVFFVINAGQPSEKKFSKKEISGFTKDSSTQRDGYVMFSKGEHCCGIETLDIGNGSGDGYAIDHITFRLNDPGSWIECALV